MEESAAGGREEEASDRDNALAHRARARAHGIADRIVRAAGYEGEIRPGKLVKLKSGGPAMTVAVFDVVDGLIYCHWIVGGRPYAARYSAEMLAPAEAGDLPAPPGKRVPSVFQTREREAAASRDAATIAESQGESADEDSRGAATIAESQGDSVD